jgi:eukaryotic-like serine/threonine-protein kinase
VDPGAVDLTGSFVLAHGTILTEVSELPEAVRHNIGAENDSDVVVSRRNSRAYAKLLDAQAASLIGHFRTPQTIAQAVARFSREARVDAETQLEAALPMLHSLIQASFLVPFDSRGLPPSKPLLSIADTVGDWAVHRCVQTMEDTEIYQVHRGRGELGALKICRNNRSAAGRAVEHEACVLPHIDVGIAPRLLSFGRWKSRPYIITEWMPGTDAGKVCQRLRNAADEHSRRAQLTLAGAILRTYAALHRRGVLHGDVHPQNIIIDGDQSVKVFDFGAARVIGHEELDAAPRAGVSFFFEPEFAEAIRSGSSPPRPTPQGEQYALAALIYLLLTGRHYLNFTVEKHEMLRQIVEDPMIPLSERGIAGSGGPQRVLQTALSKAPTKRFDSLEQLANAWELALL